MRRQRKIKWLFLMTVLFIMCGYGFFFLEQVVKPAIASIGEIKAKSMVVQTINKAVRTKFLEELHSLDFLDIRTDENGRITLIQADSIAMTELSYDLAVQIQSDIRNIEEEKILVPIGTILGSQILSQVGPRVRMKVLPLGTSKVGFTTEFVDAGINQTKYKIYLKVESQAKVIVPFSTNGIKIDTELLVAEAVIVGDVPQTYIRVPGEDMMDAWNNAD